MAQVELCVWSYVSGHVVPGGFWPWTVGLAVQGGLGVEVENGAVIATLPAGRETLAHLKALIQIGHACLMCAQCFLQQCLLGSVAASPLSAYASLVRCDA
jgi:hypothetical protein